MVGVRLGGSEEKGVSAVDLGAALRRNKLMLSVTSADYMSSLTFCAYATPYRDVQFGAVCDVPLTKGDKPQVAFGTVIQGRFGSEWRWKVANDGRLFANVKTRVTPSVDVNVSCNMDTSSIFHGSHKAAVGVEVRI